ncbi:MAG TPA: transposase [Candidatus Sulfomarinibacteraceae bacterium]|nr:transposase [Candidatus Sulfomarinibacteraceae bacterium]
MSTRRTYSREFKLEALRLWQTTDKSAGEVEKDLGITHGLLYKWKRKFKAEGEDAYSGQMLDGLGADIVTHRSGDHHRQPHH